MDEEYEEWLLGRSQMPMAVAHAAPIAAVVPVALPVVPVVPWKPGTLDPALCLHARLVRTPGEDGVLLICRECGLTATLPRCMENTRMGRRCHNLANTNDGLRCMAHDRGTDEYGGGDPSEAVGGSGGGTAPVRLLEDARGLCHVLSAKTGKRCTIGRVRKLDGDPALAGYCMIHARWARKGARYTRLSEAEWEARGRNTLGVRMPRSDG